MEGGEGGGEEEGGEEDREEEEGLVQAGCGTMSWKPMEDRGVR